MAHKMRVVPLTRGSANINLPDNAGILAVTTVNNAPALIITVDGEFSTSIAVYRFDVYDLGLNETVSATREDFEFIGHTSTGTRGFAIFKGPAI